MADEAELDGLRKGAELELQFMLGLRDRILTELATTARWQMTSLVLLNSGAAVASLGRAPAGHLWPIGFFVLGILLGLVTGSLSNRIGGKILGPATQFAAYWISVMEDGERVESVEAELKGNINTITKASRWTYGCGIASLAAFVGGIVAFGTVLSATP